MSMIGTMKLFVLVALLTFSLDTRNNFLCDADTSSGGQHPNHFGDVGTTHSGGRGSTKKPTNDSNRYDNSRSAATPATKPAVLVVAATNSSRPATLASIVTKTPGPRPQILRPTLTQQQRSGTSESQSAVAVAEPSTSLVDYEMDPCYDQNSGEAIRCQPEFSDVAFSKNVHSTSTCGSPANVHCVLEPSRSARSGGDQYSTNKYNSSVSSTEFFSNLKWAQFNEDTFLPKKLETRSSNLNSSETKNSSNNKKLKRFCFECNQNNPNKSHPTSYLTDLNNPLSPSCWVSRPREKLVNLTLNLGKKHEFTYVSVEFCPGSRPPDSVIVWKSLDHGSTWSPIKYFSTDCPGLLANPAAAVAAPTLRHNRRDRYSRNYNPYNNNNNNKNNNKQLQGNQSKLPKKNAMDGFGPKKSLAAPTAAAAASATSKNAVGLWANAPTFQPTCSSILKVQNQPMRLAFTATEGLNGKGSPDPDVNVELRDWITFSDLKLTLIHARPHTNNTTQPLASPDTDFFAVSNLNVGARCKCNGHASECLEHPEKNAEEEEKEADGAGGGGDDDEDYDDGADDDDYRSNLSDKNLFKTSVHKPKCNCRHNTKGTECDQCKALYQDRPWARATSKDANECVACNCNSHARSCRFNEQLYKASKELKSGGVCVRCRHHTSGRYCHLCADGYYRTPGRSLADKKVCSACSCHPVGSINQICNRTTGQCQCKKGVGGRTCDRCIDGYQQGMSPSRPCVEIKPSKEIANRGERGNLCQLYCRRAWSLTNDFAKRVCRENYVIMQLRVLSKRFKIIPVSSSSSLSSSSSPPSRFGREQQLSSRTWVRYKVDVLNVFNKKPETTPTKKLNNPPPPPPAKTYKDTKSNKDNKNSNKALSARVEMKNVMNKPKQPDVRLILPGSKMVAWTKLEDAKSCSCLNLVPGYVYLVAIKAPSSRPKARVERREKKDMEAFRKNLHRLNLATHRIRVSNDAKDDARNQAGIYMRTKIESPPQHLMEKPKHSEEKQLDLTKKTFQVSAETPANVTRASFKMRAKRDARREERSRATATGAELKRSRSLANHQQQQQLSSNYFPTALSRPKYEDGFKRQNKVLAASSPVKNKMTNNNDDNRNARNNMTKNKKKSSHDRGGNKRRERIFLRPDSFITAWNVKETRELFNRLDCF